MVSTATLEEGGVAKALMDPRSIKRVFLHPSLVRIIYIRFAHRKAAIKLRVISHSFRHSKIIFHLKEFLSFPNIIILLPVAFDNLYQLILVQNWIRNCSVKDQYVYCCTQRKCFWSSEKIPIESNFERKTTHLSSLSLLTDFLSHDNNSWPSSRKMWWCPKLPYWGDGSFVLTSSTIRKEVTPRQLLYKTQNCQHVYKYAAKAARLLFSFHYLYRRLIVCEFLV